MRTSFSRCLLIILAFVIRCWSAAAQIPGEPTPTISSQLSGAAAPQAQLVPVARLEGLEFVNGSGSQIVLERDGKRYLIDTKSQTIREFVSTTMASAQAPVPSGQTTAAPPAAPVTKPEEKKEPETYYTEDIVLWNLPTAMHLPKKALMIDFTHRFTFDEAFEPGAVSRSFWTGRLLFLVLGLLMESLTGSSQASIGLRRPLEESFSFPLVLNSLAGESGSSIFEHVPFRRRRNRSLPKQVHHKPRDRSSS